MERKVMKFPNDDVLSRLIVTWNWAIQSASLIIEPSFWFGSHTQPYHHGSFSFISFHFILRRTYLHQETPLHSLQHNRCSLQTSSFHTHTQIFHHSRRIGSHSSWHSTRINDTRWHRLIASDCPSPEKLWNPPSTLTTSWTWLLSSTMSFCIITLLPPSITSSHLYAAKERRAITYIIMGDGLPRSAR